MQFFHLCIQSDVKLIEDLHQNLHLCTCYAPVQMLSNQYQYLTLKFVYLKSITLIWKIDKPFIQATNRDNVVLPAPETPINSKWPCG